MAIKCAVCYVMAEGDTCPGCGAPQPMDVVAPTPETRPDPTPGPTFEAPSAPFTTTVFEPEAVVPDQRILLEPRTDEQIEDVEPSPKMSTATAAPRKRWRFPYEIRRRVDPDSPTAAESG